MVLAGALWLGWTELKTLRNENAELNFTLAQTNVILAAERVRSTRVEEAAERIHEREEVNQAQLTRFERKLDTLGRQSETTQSLLDTVVPLPLLCGLRAFPAASDSCADTVVSANPN